MKNFELICRGKRVRLGGRPRVMGILNVTPDSFSDGGRYVEAGAAISHGLQMVNDGADFIDVGGESSRPGSARVEPAEQIKRVVPVIKELTRQVEVPVSIDTMHSEVAVAALDAGAAIINDISGLRYDPNMAALAGLSHVPVILMHMKGMPETMQEQPYYEDVVGEIATFLRKRVDYAVENGVEPYRIVVDPGIGFGKTVEHNLLILKNLESFRGLGCPLLVGTSRKRFIGSVLGREDPQDRLTGSLATAAWCAGKGVQILRVHDVRETVKVLKMWEAIEQARQPG